jgi:hypothetical protein
MSAELIASLKALELELLNLITNRSWDALALLLGDDLIEFTPSGRVFDKPSLLVALADSEATWSDSVYDDVRLVMLASDVALLTYRHEARCNGAKVRSLRSSIWRRADDRWQIVFHQGTPL